MRKLRDFFALFSPFFPFISPCLFVNLIGVLWVLPCSEGTAIFFGIFTFLTLFRPFWLVFDPIFDPFLVVLSSAVGSNVRQKPVRKLRDFFALFSLFWLCLLPFYLLIYIGFSVFYLVPKEPRFFFAIFTFLTLFRPFLTPFWPLFDYLLMPYPCTFHLFWVPPNVYI